MMLLQIISTQLGWLCPLVIWLGLVGFFCAIAFAAQDGIVRLKRLHQIPCDRCAFYTGEHCLKCTIHPYKAFTEEAVNCQDWAPQIPRSSHPSLHKHKSYLTSH